MGNVKERWSNMRIKTKIALAYLVLLIFSFLATVLMFYMISSAYTEQELGKAGTQTVSALNGNLSLIFDSVTQSSNLIYFDDEVQKALRSVNSSEITSDIYQTINKSLINLILSGDYISGVYIRDTYGHFYSSYTNAPKKVNLDKIEQTNLYKTLSSHNGEGYFIHGSEGIIEYYNDTDYITYVREIRDQNTYETLAMLLVTVNEETIQEYFGEVAQDFESEFFVLDKNNEYVVSPQENEDVITDIVKKNVGIQKNAYTVQNMKDEQVLVVCQNLGIEDWRLIGIFKSDSRKLLAPYYTTIVGVISCISVFFVFWCLIILTKLIFKPLSNVEKHMLMAEQGNFVQMVVDEKHDEIGNLKRVYNHMITSIQELIEQVKEEEKIIARSEFDLLQAQINPHFLYNTLDAVSALALMKDFDNCFRMTQALGSFYRNSLNSGKTFVSIEEELQCIQSYLTILNIRYDNKIKVEFDVEQQVLGYRIIKLLLQPLVENAVHHGIKGKSNEGIVWIRVFLNEDEVVFMVSDDGVGMSEERIQEVMSGKAVTGKSGFGIYSLIQRIRLYYGIENPVMIHSEIGSGTEVVVRIKKMVLGGENYGEKD